MSVRDKKEQNRQNISIKRKEGNSTARSLADARRRIIIKSQIGINFNEVYLTNYHGFGLGGWIWEGKKELNWWMDYLRKV